MHEADDTPDPVYILPSSGIPSMGEQLRTIHSKRFVLQPDRGAIGAIIGELARRSGMSQRELALRMGLGRQNIQPYIHGRVANPSVKKLIQFAEAAGARVVVEFE